MHDRKMDHADQLVQKVLEVIEYFRPRWWWIENPSTGLLKDRPYMAGLPFVDLDCCQFSDCGYRKPTRFWGKFPGGVLESVICDGHHCPNLVGKPKQVGGKRRHRIQLSGWKYFPSTLEQYRIPPKLVKYLMGFDRGSDQSGVSNPPPVVPIWVSGSGAINVGAFGGNQLMIKVQAMDQFGNIDWINALVDTGAQANLLSTAKFCGGDWQNSAQLLSLLTVTGELLGGGDKEITLQMVFGVIGGGKWETTGKFHGADIRVDAILSYPWLKDQRLAVCPSSGC